MKQVTIFSFLIFSTFFCFTKDPHLVHHSESILDHEIISGNVNIPDSLLKDSTFFEEQNIHKRRELIHPDTLLLKKQKQNLLSDSLKFENGN